MEQEQVLSPSPCSKLGSLSSQSLDDLFPTQNTEVDVSLEWLSIFVEDCLSSTGNCLPAPKPNTNVQKPPPPPLPIPPPTPPPPTTTLETTTKALETKNDNPPNPPPLTKFVVPSKARSKRKRSTTTTTKRNYKTGTTSFWSHNLNPYNQSLHFINQDPPLLQQAYWLADSELIVPNKKQDTTTTKVEEKTKEQNEADEEDEEEEEGEEEKGSFGIMFDGGGSNGSGGQMQQQQQPRRCTHCLSQRTPQWRAGPLGPKTLCNACGVRYKSGRLLPEYRPAKSPTFVSYLHSNSHKKVMEMRNHHLP